MAGLTAHRHTYVPAFGQMPWMFFPTLLHKGSKIKWQLCAGALREAVFAQIGWLVCFGH